MVQEDGLDQGYPRPSRSLHDLQVGGCSEGSLFSFFMVFLEAGVLGTRDLAVLARGSEVLVRLGAFEEDWSSLVLKVFRVLGLVIYSAFGR